MQGAALSARVIDHLIDLRAELSVGAASRVQMRFVYFDTWATTFRIGDVIEVEMDDGSGATGPALKTELTGLAVEATVPATQIVVTGYARVTARHDLNVRVHINKSYKAVIEEWRKPLVSTCPWMKRSPSRSSRTSSGDHQPGVHQRHRSPDGDGSVMDGERNEVRRARAGARSV